MRDKLALFLLAPVLALNVAIGSAYATTEKFYTLVPGDERDWNQLVRNMGLDWDDAVRYILQWNPEIKNPYGLKVGQKLRVPGASTQPSYPSYTSDFSRWVVIGTHTTRFVSSPNYRVDNIVNGANAINNWFNDASHPYVTPRDALSLNWILGETTQEKGYKLGQAILIVNGVPTDVPAWGGGICQIPSTIFPALLKAGLDVVERTNHSYYPYWWWSYPEGFGWDATTGTPGDPDLVWRNMYDYPVRLWLTADRQAMTLRADVWGPPELKTYQVAIDGPYLTSVNPPQPTRELNWITWAATTAITQKVNVGGSVWEKTFKSYYIAAPYGH